MYAFVLRAHQKIDRVAYRHLRQLCDTDDVLPFPGIKNILHFEGRNGPDATKFKKQVNVEQPWHFVDPFDLADTRLSKLIDGHYGELVTALKAHDKVRAAFEAAWLAHALVDGLTPAHHYPYEQELEALRGEGRESRKGIVGRAYVKGETKRESMQLSMKLVGPKGLLTTHAMFGAGAYSIIAPLRLTKALPDKEHLAAIHRAGVSQYFQQQAREIAMLELYTRYYKTGWTPKLSRDIRRELAPRMVRMVTLSWYSALIDAGFIKAEK